MRISASLGVLHQPTFKMVLRSGKGHDRAFLRKRSGIAGAVALNGIDRLGDRLGSGEIPESPAGHGIRLSKPVNENRLLVMRLRKTGNTDVFSAVIDELLINLVAHDQDTLLDADVTQCSNFVAGVNRASRIARRIENEQPAARCDRGAELLRSNFELSRVRG